MIELECRAEAGGEEERVFGDERRYTFIVKSMGSGIQLPRPKAQLSHAPVRNTEQVSSHLSVPICSFVSGDANIIP